MHVNLEASNEHRFVFTRILTYPPGLYPTTMTTAQLLRLSKVILVGFFGLYVLLVAFGNTTDYNTNFAFVQHVLSMDTTFQGSRLMYRAITTPAIHHGAYMLIIATEWLIAMAALYGASQMLRHLKSPSSKYNQAKKWAIISLLLGLALWFLGFQIIGGEWFAMWQSETWNGLAPASRLTTYIGICLLSLMLPESD